VRGKHYAFANGVSRRAGSKWELDELQVSLERLNIVWKEFESISDQMVLFDEEEGCVDPAIDK